MSFDQNMIIDATTGSIARFVNHSCSPNCRMIKWIVSGQPRMALFAGDRPIMTGEELTYDYNFDPFSAKNVQKCLCGSANCRGVLGPKPKEVKPPKAQQVSKEEHRKTGSNAAKGAIKGAVKTGKRKLKELLTGDRDEEDQSKTAKKRRIKTATGAAKAIKQSISNVSVRAKSALSKKTASGYVAKRPAMAQAKMTSFIKVNSLKGGARKPAAPSNSGSSGKATIVAATAPAAAASGKSKHISTKNAAASRKRTPSRKVLESTIGEAAPEETPSPGARAGGKAGGALAKPRKGPEASNRAKARMVEGSIYDFPS